jgi:hypothetical protein
MPSTTHNGITFSVSSEPMPSRRVEQRATTGSAMLTVEHNTSTVYETKMLEFEQAILGWSRKDPVNTDRLNRYYPLTWPLHTQGSLDALQLSLSPNNRTMKEVAVAPGAALPAGSGPVVNNTGQSWWPTAPREQYMCDFGPLPYSRFMTDAEAYSGGSPPKELGRFIKVYEQAVPREFRRPDYGFVTATNNNEVLQIGFVPFIQAEVIYTWFQVPYGDAVPWNTIESTYLKVNDNDFDGDELTVGYPAGTLLLTKTGPLDNWYYGPGGKRYVDVIYYFTYNPNGWNRYMLANGTYVNLYRKNVTPLTPPYLSADFTQLFNPGAL